MDLLHAVKLRHGGDGFTFPPKEGVLRIFFAFKLRRFRPGANPRTWVPKPLSGQFTKSGKPNLRDKLNIKDVILKVDWN